MENQKEDILLKARSSRRCINAGYKLYLGQFKRIFRYSWAAAFVYAAVCSIGGTLMVLNPQMTPVSLGIIIIAEALFAAYGFALLKQHQQTGTIALASKWVNLDTYIFIRTLKSWLCQLVVYLLAGAVVAGISMVAVRHLSTYTALACIGLTVLLALCLLLPMAFIAVRYVLTDGPGFWRQLSQGYPVGLRHWGFIFTVVFVALLVEIVLSLFTSLPASIISLANIQATQSLMMGDPNGMPSYIGWLAAATFLLIGFIQAYVQLSVMFPLYYLYGSIEVLEQERNEFKQKQLSL